MNAHLMVSVRLHQLYIEQTWLTTQMIYLNDYFGLTDTTFKERYQNHNRDFKHEKYENNTELAKYIWQLRRNNISFSDKWKVITKVYGNPNPVLCKLCLTEKLWIINFINDEKMLNKKSELISNCRHLNKHLLRNVKRK